MYTGEGILDVEVRDGAVTLEDKDKTCNQFSCSLLMLATVD